MIETYRGVVYPKEIDHMGHMNVQYYTTRFDEATWHLCSVVGLTPDYMRNEHKGMAALEQLIKYKSEVLAGTLLVIHSRILEVTGKKIRILHIMYDTVSMQEKASCELLGIHIDRNTRKSCPLPSFVLDNYHRHQEIDSEAD